MYDIAIIGAGPAGATLARLVAGRYRVLLVDRRDLSGEGPPGGRGKCCGGLLAPDAQRMLGRLGLGLPRGVLVGPQLFLVRVLDLPGGRQRHYQRHYINVDREAFDRWGVSLLPPGVDVRFGWRLKGWRSDGGPVTIELARGGRTESVRAEMLVGADGAGSTVRRRLRPAGPATRRYLAVQEWYRSAAAPPCFWAIFDPQVTDFYSWIIPKDGGVILGSALPAGGGAARRFDLLKARLRPMGFPDGPPVRREAALLLRPGGAGEVCLGAGRAVLIGEAAGFVSPSSAEGFSYAFASAAALAGAVAPTLAGAAARYRAATAPLRRSIAAKALKARLLYNRWVRAALMGSGVRSVPVVPEGGRAGTSRRTPPIAIGGHCEVL